jgi:hypothetical protein
MSFQGTTRTDPDGRSLAHPVLISDEWRPGVQLVRTLAHPCETRADPLCVGYVQDGKVFSSISSLPSSLSADEGSVFVRMIHRYYAAV